MNGATDTSFPPRWRFSIMAKLLAIVLVFVTAFVALLLLVVLSLRITAGVRAYIGGEGLWSKGQKDAVYYLQRYARSRAEPDYLKYRAAVAIPLGVRVAREEMLKEEFDPAVVERGFVQGLNHPDDVPSLTFLFRNFRGYGPMQHAIDTWIRGDEGIEELERAATELHRAVEAGALDAAREREFLDRIEVINSRLTPLELEFSATLGEAAREVRDLLLALVLATAVLLLAAGLWVSWRIAQGVRTGLQALADGTRRVDRGDLGQPIVLHSRDEFDDLARAFNDMMAHRRDAERALVRHSEELARSNAELEQFAYVASHDLQEPLRTVASYAQLLVRRAADRLGEDTVEFVRHINEAVQRMRRLIDDLLSYSRVAPEARPPAPADLNQLLQTALSNLENAIRTEGAQVTHDPLPTLAVPAQLFTQLLQNLVGNAIKFRGAEPPRVHVSAQRQGGEWLFSVRDNGIGVEPQHSERIFVLFQRLHPRDVYPGSGLGLAICKKIVEQQGGRIWVEPASPGSDFRFTLPATPL